MRRKPIKNGTQLIFPVLRIRDFFCVFLRYQIVINCVFSYFNWVITQIRSLIKVLPVINNYACQKFSTFGLDYIVKFTFDLYIQMIPSKVFVSQKCTYSSSSFCSRLGIETFTVSLGCLLPDISDIRALELAGKTVYM